MLDNDDIIVVSLYASNKMRDLYSLLDIQVRGRLIKDVDICLLDHHDHQRKPL